MNNHNTHYATLVDYLDGRPQSFHELVDCYLYVCRRMIKLRQYCDDTDVLSTLHDESFSCLCELSELQGYIKSSIYNVDSHFPWSLVDKELSK